MAVDREEAAGDGGRIAFFRHVDANVARGGLRRRGFGRGLRGGGEHVDHRYQAAVEAHLPAVDSAFATRDAGIGPQAATKRRHHLRKAGMTGQHNPRFDLAAGERQRDTGAVLARRPA